jgi:hypothetical protein
MAPALKLSPEFIKRVSQIPSVQGMIHRQSAAGADPARVVQALANRAALSLKKTADSDPSPMFTRGDMDTTLAKSVTAKPPSAMSSAEMIMQRLSTRQKLGPNYGRNSLVGLKNLIVKRASQVARELTDIEDNNNAWRKWYFSNNRQDDTLTSRYYKNSTSTNTWSNAGYKAAGMRPPIKPSIEALKNLAVKGKQEFALYKLHNAQMRTAKGNNPLRSTKSIARKALKLNEKTSGLIPGGMADKAHKKPSDFDPKQIAMGMKVEKEHTPDPKKQKEIAMDHLTEFPKYYTALDKMEKGLKKKANKFYPALGALVGGGAAAAASDAENRPRNVLLGAGAGAAAGFGAKAITKSLSRTPAAAPAAATHNTAPLIAMVPVKEQAAKKIKSIPIKRPGEMRGAGAMLTQAKFGSLVKAINNLLQ